MSDKKGVDREDPDHETRRVYADLIAAVVMVAMLCGTIIATTHMWIEERQTELLVEEQLLRGG